MNFVLPIQFAPTIFFGFDATWRTPVTKNSLNITTNIIHSGIILRSTKIKNMLRIKILSTRGSKKVPKTVCLLKRRAIHPSAQSVHIAKINTRMLARIIFGPVEYSMAAITKIKKKRKIVRALVIFINPTQLCFFLSFSSFQLKVYK